MVILDMLVNTSATASEIRAARFDPMRRTLEHGLEFRLEEFFVLAHYPRRDGFTVDDIRNEDGLAACSCNSFAAKSDVLDF